MFALKSTIAVLVLAALSSATHKDGGHTTAAIVVKTNPVYSAPTVETTPVYSAPVETTPIYSAPVETTPIYSAPVETTPVYSAPVETTPAYSAPTIVPTPPYATSGGNQTVVTTTKVVSRYTTYCPEPTTMTIGTHTYTVTEATTLTITDCPCTIVEPCHTCKPQPTYNTFVKPPVPETPAPTPSAEKPPPATVPTAPGNPPPAGSPPAVIVSGAASRLASFGVAVLAAVLVGSLAL